MHAAALTARVRTSLRAEEANASGASVAGGHLTELAALAWRPRLVIAARSASSREIVRGGSYAVRLALKAWLWRIRGQIPRVRNVFARQGVIAVGL